MTTPADPLGRHTPGPWRLWKRDDGDLITNEAGDEGVARVIQSPRNPFEKLPDVVAANGRLLTAAPELFAALKVMAADMDRAGGDGYGMPECPWCHFQRDGNEHAADCELLVARDAIAKAEGRGQR